MKSTDKVRYDYCLNPSGRIAYMRAIQGHSGGEQIDPQYQSNTKKYFWTTYIYHLGSSWDLSSLCSAGLITGGRNAKNGRQTYFFTAVDPMDPTMITPRVEEGQPRMLQYKLKWRAAYDTVYWFDLTSAQDKGLEFWQTKSNAIVLYDPMPSECLVTALNWVKGCEEPEVLHRKIVLHPQRAPSVMFESNQHQEQTVRVPDSTDSSER